MVYRPWTPIKRPTGAINPVCWRELPSTDFAIQRQPVDSHQTTCLSEAQQGTGTALSVPPRMTVRLYLGLPQQQPQEVAPPVHGEYCHG